MHSTPAGVVLTSWPLGLDQGSGTALFASGLARSLRAHGAAAETVNPRLDTSDYRQFTFDRLWFNTQLADDPRLARARWILGLDYDGFALPRRSGQRFVASARALFADIARTEPEPFRTLLLAQAYFEGHNFRRADCVAAPSEYAARQVAEHYHVPVDQIQVVPNGIDLAEWDELRPADPEPARRPTVLAVSKLYPRKKIDVLVRATPLVRRRIADIEVRIVGGGFEWNAWRQLAADLGVEGSLVWLGDIAERRRIVAEFANCHVFVHPSIQESFGNVVLEAMAAGRPLVVSDAAAPPELVRASGGGLVVPPDDPEALAEAIIRLLDDAELRQALGRRGRSFAATFTWDQAAARYLELLEP